MFSPLSIAPAPIPRGKPNSVSIQVALAKDIPSKAKAVRSVETKATSLTPNLLIIFALNILENKVKQDIGVVIVQASEELTPSSSQIAGQAEPSKESGMPKPIYPVKITINNKVAIIVE